MALLSMLYILPCRIPRSEGESGGSGRISSGSHSSPTPFSQS